MRSTLTTCCSILVLAFSTRLPVLCAQATADPSVDQAISSLKDADVAKRIEAAKTLGATQDDRAVDALLAALPGERSPFADAVLLALGHTHSSKALPALTKTLDRGLTELRPAAVAGLVAHGSPEAIVILKDRVTTVANMNLRYRIARGLVEDLRQPMEVNWVVPFIMMRARTPEWHEAMDMLRSHAGKEAIPALLSCLDFTVSWSGRNADILKVVKNCPGAPDFDYIYDRNREGTKAELAANHKNLDSLLDEAGPIMAVSLPLRKVAIVPLKTDPPIEFEPVLTEITGGIDLTSGFLKIRILNRSNVYVMYSSTEMYRGTYEVNHYVRWLLKYPDLYEALKITPQQAEQLSKLPQQNLVNPTERNIPWMDMYVEYMESPSGGAQTRAKDELLDSAQGCSQDYHAGVTEFALAARKILTPQQMMRLPDLVEQRHINPPAPTTATRPTETAAATIPGTP